MSVRFPRFTVPQERALVDALAVALAGEWDGPGATLREPAGHLLARLRQPGGGLARASERELAALVAAADRRLADAACTGAARRSLATAQAIIGAYLAFRAAP